MQLKIIKEWNIRNLEKEVNNFLRDIPFSDVVKVSYQSTVHHGEPQFYAYVLLRQDAPIKEETESHAPKGNP